MPLPNEQALIEASQEGDLDAFNQLVEAYQDRVYSIALRMLRDHAAAEDAAQDAFLSAYRSIRQYRGGSFQGWLLRIVRNATYDMLRAQARRRTQSIEEDFVSFEAELVAADPTPQEVALNAELGSQISNALSDLPDDQRLAVVLVDIEGLSYDEATLAMGVSMGTLKSRVSRGRQKLREALLADPELLPARFRPLDEGTEP